jgi:hypothetical protein
VVSRASGKASHVWFACSGGRGIETWSVIQNRGEQPVEEAFERENDRGEMAISM